MRHGIFLVFCDHWSRLLCCCYSLSCSIHQSRPIFAQASFIFASLFLTCLCFSPHDVQLDEPLGGVGLPGEPAPTPPKKSKKKREGSTLRKAPQAPKRFKSSYICFFMEKQPEIKEALGENATVRASFAHETLGETCRLY